MKPLEQDQQEHMSSRVMSFVAETDYYNDFLVWDDQHRSWRLPFAFLLATDISPPVFFSLTWRKSEQGWKTSATTPM